MKMLVARGSQGSSSAGGPSHLGRSHPGFQRWPGQGGTARRLLFHTSHAFVQNSVVSQSILGSVFRLVSPLSRDGSKDASGSPRLNQTLQASDAHISISDAGCRNPRAAHLRILVSGLSVCRRHSPVQPLTSTAPRRRPFL